MVKESIAVVAMLSFCFGISGFYSFFHGDGHGDGSAHHGVVAHGFLIFSDVFMFCYAILKTVVAQRFFHMIDFRSFLPDTAFFYPFSKKCGQDVDKKELVPKII